VNGSIIGGAEALSRRAATEADVPFLLELRRQTMTAHQLAAEVVPSDEERRRRVLLRYEHAEIILQGTRPVGLLKVARDALDWELIQIQLIPELQGRGIGSELIGRLVLEAEQAGASLRLSVLQGSPARRLYERLGFTVVGEKGHALEMSWTSSR
jgi:GNAT superfamily N-acetyltransferase